MLIAIVESDDSLQYQDSTDSGSASYRGVAELPILELHNVLLNRETNVIKASGPDPYFLLQTAFSPPVSYGRLSLVPLTKDQYGFELYYQPQSKGGFDEKHKIEGVPMEFASRALIAWSLPEPAVHLRVDLPENAQFIFQRLDLGQNVHLVGRKTKTTGTLAQMFLVFFISTIVLYLVFNFTPFPRPRSVKVIASVLGGAFLILILLLPPMQGPDESAHWKFATYFYRPGGAGETATFNLNETIGAEKIKFRPEQKLNPEKLLYSIPPLRGSPVLPSFSNYGYVHRISYPFVFLSSLLFSRIETVRDSLLFYYLCRFLPVVALFSLFCFLNSRYSIPYTALFFVSLPLVVQQFTVVSPDTLQNVATVIAVILFLELRNKFRSWLYFLMLGLCLTVTYSKIILAGVLLLPLYHFPTEWIPKKRWILAALLFLFPLLGCFACYIVWLMMLKVGDVNPPEIMRQQVAFLSSWRGFMTFGQAYFDALGNFCNVDAWAGPLGWLDTRLNPYHLRLITLSGISAVVFDLWTFEAKLPSIWSKRRLEVVTVIIISVAGLVFASLSDSLIYYILCTAARISSIIGLQVRHFFPPVLVALLLPLGLFASKRGSLEDAEDAEGGRRRWDSIVNVTAMLVLGMLFFMRTEQLTIDLLIRYWE